MSDPTHAEAWDRVDDTHRDEVDIETYEVDDGVVFFDTDNPLAWVEAKRTVHLADLT